MTVFLTTHYMEEAAEADYVVIIDSGEISAEGTPLELKNTFTGDFITLYNVRSDEIEMLGKPYEKIPDAYRVSVENTEAATNLIVKYPVGSSRIRILGLCNNARAISILLS